MISDCIKFVIWDEQGNRTFLDNPTNMFTVIDGILYKDHFFSSYSNSGTFLILVHDERIQFLCYSGVATVDGDTFGPQDYKYLTDGAIIYINSYKFLLKLEYDDKDIEKLVDMYMNDELRLPIDLDTLFIRYAKKIED